MGNSAAHVPFDYAECVLQLAGRAELDDLGAGVRDLEGALPLGAGVARRRARRRSYPLVVGKLIDTTAALGAGAPGGVLSPTMGVAGGTALLVLLAGDSFGAGVEHPWDATVAAVAIGVAVGMRSPLVAISSSQNCSVITFSRSPWPPWRRVASQSRTRPLHAVDRRGRPVRHLR
jgi:hypothetical protein